MPALPALRPVTLAAALLAASACATSGGTKQPWPKPALAAEPMAFLWEVTRPEAPGRPLYLTGSIHAGRSGQFAFPPAFERAIGRADVLVVEADPAEAAGPEVQGAVFSLGLYRPPDQLDAHLDDATRALLPAALERNGLVPRAVASLRPWMLAVTLGVMELQRAGYDGRSGVDALLLARFQGQREVVQLESAVAQLRMLAELPEPVQVLMLRDVLEGGPMMAVSLAQIAAAWEGGNPDAVAAATFERAGEPEMAAMYEAVFYARNRRMAEKLAPLVGGPRVHLVAVGAGHVVGPQGLLALLAARGLRVRQLERD